MSRRAYVQNYMDDIYEPRRFYEPLMSRALSHEHGIYNLNEKKKKVLRYYYFLFK